MNASLKLGRIWGIPIGLHTSWFLFFILLTWSLAVGYFPEEYPKSSITTNLLFALITSILFFSSVLAHELGHSYVALKNQIPVRGITLFIFGGVAQIGGEPQSPGAEFRIAIAGPLVSLILAGLFGLIWLTIRPISDYAAPSNYLMRINFLLAMFNMIPGFPLDGGRVLRAVIWWFTNNFQRATQIASFSGQFFAFGFIAYGIFLIIQGELMNGLWMIFIGWFLQNAAASAYSQMNFQAALRGIKVQQIMTNDCTEVAGLESLNQIIQERVLSGGQRCFYVAEQGKLQGMITLGDITKIPKTKWRFTTAEKVMIPFNRLIQVSPDTDLLEALQLMDNANIAQVPVISQGQLLGSLSREQIVHYLRLRSELGI